MFNIGASFQFHSRRLSPQIPLPFTIAIRPAEPYAAILLPFPRTSACSAGKCILRAGTQDAGAQYPSQSCYF